MKVLKSWLVILISLGTFFGWSHTVWAAQQCGAHETTYVVNKGDNLSKVFPRNWSGVATRNHLANPGRINIGQTLCVPGTSVITNIAKPKSLVIRKAQKPDCITLGVAPFNPEAILEKALLGIDLLPLSDAQKSEAKQKITAKDFAQTNVFLPTNARYDMLFMSHGKPKLVYNKRLCSPENGGKVELGDLIVLSDGTEVVIPRRCGNVAIMRRFNEQAEPEQEEVKTEAEIEETTEGTVIETVARRYDYDLGTYVGADPHVTFAGFEGAGYPVLIDGKTGRHAFGVGLKGDGWKGSTAEGFQYNGSLAAIGPAYKWSGKSGRDLNAKLLVGRVKEYGHQDEYRSWQPYKALCLATNFTDASRERARQEWLPEWTMWFNYCKLQPGSYGHTWQGSPIADTSELGKSVALLSIGGKLFVTKNMETLGMTGDIAKMLQPFVELGGNREAPMPWTGHAYLGLRTTDKIWSIGVGPHFSHLGSVPGFSITFDAGRWKKLKLQQARWTAMVKSAAAAGIALD